jgi:hypothetical protein
MKRLYYLDYLKVALTVLVVFHHAAIPYSPGGEWAYTTSHPEEMMPWIWHFLSTNASFFMGLFFLISGYFVPRSFDGQGTATFLRKKLVRLGIPLLLITTLLTVLTGQLEVGHMWYVEGLLVLCIIYAIIKLVVKPINNRTSVYPAGRSICDRPDGHARHREVLHDCHRGNHPFVPGNLSVKAHPWCEDFPQYRLSGVVLKPRSCNRLHLIIGNILGYAMTTGRNFSYL